MNGQSTDNRPRLDQLLVERGFFATRSRARDAIQRGTVKVDGRPITKPGQMVVRDAALAVDDPASAYVSRAALKLVAALDHFDLNVKGRTALDIGASTGGFTQVLLERGAHHVIAIDVGHDQLHESLRHDPRVTSKEGVNARALELAHLDTRAVDCIVSDVSFISLRLALPRHWLWLKRCYLRASRQTAIRGGTRSDRQGRHLARSRIWRAHGARTEIMAGNAARLACSRPLSVAHRRRRRQS